MLTCVQAMEKRKMAGLDVPVVYVDDGHGFDPETGVATPGKRTPPMPNGQVVYENQFNHAVTQLVGGMLAFHGVRVVPVAPEMSDVTLHDRVMRANTDYIGQGRPPMAVFLSVHYNALNGRFDNKSGGVETFHYPGSKNGQRLATLVHKRLLQGTRQVDRGVKTARFYVLKYTIMPAALAECGFMDSLVEAGRMLDMAFQVECAREMAEGILEYFDIPVDFTVFRAVAAVEKGYREGRLENKQYWMECAMEYRVASGSNLVYLLEK